MTPHSSFACIFNDRAKAVDAALIWQDALWTEMLSTAASPPAPPESASERDQKPRKGRIADPDLLKTTVAKSFRAFNRPAEDVTAIADAVLQTLFGKRLAWKTRLGETVISLRAADPCDLFGVLFPECASDRDRLHLIYSGIRRIGDCTSSSRTADVFHCLAAAINSELISPKLLEGDDLSSARLAWSYDRQLLPTLRRALARPQLPGAQPASAAVPSERRLCAFLLCARTVGYLQLDERPGRVVCRAQSVDAEFLLSHLLGLHTHIEGFDELFGGGGLQLVDSPVFDGGSLPDSDRLRGRTILAAGRYGTGKSLLALQFAVEVARRGGVAWVLALEQEAEECLFSLRSMQILPPDGSVQVAHDTTTAKLLLTEGPTDRGLLILLGSRKDSYRDFLASLQQDAREMNRFPLRLMVIDPVNAISRGEDPDVGVSRSDTLDAFEAVKNLGTNIWINAEDSVLENSSFFEQNIADTVIHLSVDESNSRGQRYIEIQKSRYQREQAGRHPFSIISGVGIRVFPSSNAVSERIRSRALRGDAGILTFGLSSLDELLGDGAIGTGDVVVLQGPVGCFKTLLGVHFLKQSATRRDAAPGQSAVPPYRLAFAAGDAHSGVSRLLRAKSPGDRPVRAQLRLGHLPDGLIQPGEMLHIFESEFRRIRYPDTVDRVLVANFDHLEMACPYLRDDEVFATTLLQLFRRQGVTSAFVSSAVRDDSPRLPRVVLEAADCIIQFDRIEFQGKTQVMLRIIKTRGMRHRREWFELYVEDNQVEVRRSPSLLRLMRDGSVQTTAVRLFLHAENRMQQDYNAAIAESVRSVLTRDAHLNSQSGLFSTRALTLGPSSVLDELQLVQLDEFQLPGALGAGPNVKLHLFDQNVWYPEDLDDLVERIRSRAFVDEKGEKKLAAVPFYANVSVLAYRTDRCDPQTLESWSALADANDAAAEDSSELLFDFVKVSGENYNCLFLEILLSLAAVPDSPEYAFDDWLSRPEAVEAATLFYRLCRRSHAHSQRQPLEAEQPMTVNLKAGVWRHWFTTLMQMVADMPLSDRTHVRVIALPGEKSVAGEWFLTVPSHSAAPDVAMSLIRALTSRDAELDRLQRGVGLPTRQSYYRSHVSEDAQVGGLPPQSSHNSNGTPLSPFLSMDVELLGRLVRNAFRRSAFGNYLQFASVLNSHLQRILDSRRFREQEARQMLRSLKDRIRAVHWPPSNHAPLPAAIEGVPLPDIPLDILGPNDHKIRSTRR